MEINKIHSVDIYINNIKADIFSQDDLNLRFNNVFADPSKIQTIQTEYSFSFTLPVTPTNEKIFDFANILSKRNKFNKRFKTHINADGILIFDGELILSNISKEGYKCNLYINRLNTVDKIFGETKLNEITDWEIDYDQDITINEYNEGNIEYNEKDVFFPLVSYGMFQKIPKEDSEFYTSKFDIDKYARIYNENFYPSINLLKLVEKCFNTKGYEVDGDIFDDVTADTICRIGEYIMNKGIKINSFKDLFFLAAKRQYIAEQNKKRKRQSDDIPNFIDVLDEGRKNFQFDSRDIDFLNSLQTDDDEIWKVNEEKFNRINEFYKWLGQELNKVFLPNEADIFMFYYRLKSNKSGVSYKKLAKILDVPVKYITDTIIKIKKYVKQSDEIQNKKKEMIDKND